MNEYNSGDEEKRMSESDNSDAEVELFGMSYGSIKSLTKSKKKKSKSTRGVKHKLPKDLENNLKKAEMLYIQNDLSHAKEILTELIKLVPSYPSPYVSLSLIEERQGNVKESEELIYMAAKLSKKDLNLWNQVYVSARRNNNKERLIESLKVITEVDNKDIESKFVLAKMLYENNEFRKSGDEYHKILESNRGNTFAIYNCCESYKKCNKKNEAIKVIEENRNLLFNDLKNSYENDKDEIMNENKRTEILRIIKMLCELYLENNQYNEVIKTIEECSEYNNNCALPLDLGVLYGISKLYLKEENEAESCFQLLFNQPIENNGESYLKVGMSYYNVGKIQKSLEIFERLVLLNEYNNSEIWIIMAKCYEIINNVEKSIEYYLKLLNVNSKYDISCLHMKLSTLYLRIGNTKQSNLHESLVDKNKLPAIKWMNILSEKDFELEVNQKMIAFINILNDYKNNNRWDEYIDLSVALIRGCSMKHDYIKEYESNEITPYSQDLLTAYCVGKAINIGSVIGENGYIELVENVYNKLYEKNELKMCSEILYITLKTYSFTDSEAYYQFQCKLIHVSIGTGMYKLCNTIMRDIVIRNKDSYGFWSLFRFIFSEIRQDPKYMVRLLNLYPLNVNLITFVGGLSINLINRDNALSELFTAYRLKPLDPILSFDIGIIYLALLRFPYELINNNEIYRYNNEYDKKENKDNNEYYIPLVIKELEIFYNLGRLYHQLHKYNFAIHYYKCLLFIYDKIVEVNDSKIMEYCNRFGIHRYCVFNLCLILKSENELSLIRYYRNKYLTI